MRDGNKRASSASQNRAGIASQLSPLSRSSLSECSSLTHASDKTTADRARGLSLCRTCEGQYCFCLDNIANAIREAEDAAYERVAVLLEQHWATPYGNNPSLLTRPIRALKSGARVSDEHAKRENPKGSSPEGMPARSDEVGDA